MDLFISAGADSVIAKPLTKIKVAAILAGEFEVSDLKQVHRFFVMHCFVLPLSVILEFSI